MVSTLTPPSQFSFDNPASPAEAETELSFLLWLLPTGCFPNVPTQLLLDPIYEILVIRENAGSFWWFGGQERLLHLPPGGFYIPTCPPNTPCHSELSQNSTRTGFMCNISKIQNTHSFTILQQYPRRSVA